MIRLLKLKFINS